MKIDDSIIMTERGVRNSLYGKPPARAPVSLDDEAIRTEMKVRLDLGYGHAGLPRSQIANYEKFKKELKTEPPAEPKESVIAGTFYRLISLLGLYP